MRGTKLGGWGGALLTAATLVAVAGFSYLGPPARPVYWAAPEPTVIHIRRAVARAFLAWNVVLPPPGRHLVTPALIDSMVAAQPARLARIFFQGCTVYDNALKGRIRELKSLSGTNRTTTRRLVAFTLTGLTVTGSTALAHWTATDHLVVYFLPWPYVPGSWEAFSNTTTMTGTAGLAEANGHWLVDQYQASFAPGSGP